MRIGKQGNAIILLAASSRSCYAKHQARRGEDRSPIPDTDTQFDADLTVEWVLTETPRGRDPSAMVTAN